jgi:hypothetical protein
VEFNVDAFFWVLHCVLSSVRCSAHTLLGVTLSVLMRMEVGSNTSTVALGDVGGDEKEPSAWGYNLATQFLRDINTGIRHSRLGESGM